MLKDKANSLVGRILKRIELFDDQATLKKECKELLHESFRDIETTIKAYHNGVVMTLKKVE